MQYFKPWIHGRKSTHGNSLKVTQFQEIKATWQPYFQHELHESDLTDHRLRGEITDKIMLEDLLLNRSWAHWQISDLVRCAPLHKVRVILKSKGKVNSERSWRL